MPLSTQAPFFTDRGIGFPFRIANLELRISNSQSEFRISQLLDSPISHNHLLRTLVPARLVAPRRLSPGRHRITSARGLALAATVGMVDRIHGDAADVRPNAAPARAAGFTQRNIFMLDIAHLAHRRPALD